MEESWDDDQDHEKEESVAHLQSEIQRLEKENTDFLAALEDAMEQYKQQVRKCDTPFFLFTEITKLSSNLFPQDGA